MLLVCLCGCAQNARQHPLIAGKIPVDGHRWYQLTNATNDLSELFDGQLEQKPNTGYNKLVSHYEAWYPLYKCEQMTIDSVLFFCYRGISAEHPVRLIAITKDWKRHTIATFLPTEANNWTGPYPERPNNFALEKPVKDFRYLVLDSWGEFPAEIELYGQYIPTALVTSAKKKIPLRNFFGVNTYEWDFSDPAAPDVPDTKNRLGAYKMFSGIRHYLDWEKLESTAGNYTFNPARNGRWNYDTFYRTMQQEGKEVLACIKTIPDWLQQTYPANDRNNENIPAPFGADQNNPASYILQAKLAFQFAARYGSNTQIQDTLLHVDARPAWPGGPYNKVRKGLGTVKYVECDNERDKWWKGRNAYQTGREYAANLSAFYDGHKGTLGSGVGVKNADKNMQVVMAGLANPDPGYVQAIIDWSAENRGYREDGTVDVPFDVINFHFYCNDANGTNNEATTGRAPEHTNAAKVAKAFVTVANQLGNMPVWVTETGYDINASSPQQAKATKKRTAEATQALWLLRTALLYSRCGIERMFTYQLYDDKTNGTERYATSGLYNADHSPRMAALYFGEAIHLLGNFWYDTTVNTAPLVDIYTNGSENAYVVLQIEEDNRNAEYTINLPNCKEAIICEMAENGRTMRKTVKSITEGKLNVIASGSPQIIVVPATRAR